MATGRTWPPGLPPITNLAGASQQPPGGVLRSSIEGALPDARLTHKDDPRRFTERMIMNAAQLQIFDGFFRNTLGKGALSFDHVNSWNGQAARLKFTGGPPAYRPQGSDLAWVVDLNLLEIAS